MKKRHVLPVVMLVSLGFSAYTITEDIIARLGMEAEYAQYSISGNLIGRFDANPMENGAGEYTFKIPYAKLLPEIIAGDKIGAAKELCEYTKKYINSEEFTAYYNELKDAAMPLRTTGSHGFSLGTLRKDLAVFELNIKNYPNDAAYVAEQTTKKEAAQKSIDSLLEAAKKPFPNKELWEKTYSENPGVLVEKRLQEYLALEATVDFDAKLTAPDQYNKRKFVNPAYEKKSEQWKAYYRAGKEVNEVLTSFAQEWLKGEIIASTKTRMSVDAEIEPDASEQVSTSESSSAESTPLVASYQSTPEQNSADSSAQAPKAKKSLFGKLTDKAKQIIKD